MPAVLDACTGCGVDRAEVWAQAFSESMARYGITNPRREAAFLAQVAHESDGFSVIIENLNYSPAALMTIWPQHFNTVNAGAYAYQPQRIANRAYAGRMGNGDEYSGDGWKFRGRGPLQTTGHDDYRDFGSACGFDLTLNPNLLIQPRLGAWAAAWEWDRSELNALADAGQFELITRKINGGLLGQPDRLARYEKALSVLTTA